MHWFSLKTSVLFPTLLAALISILSTTDLELKKIQSQDDVATVIKAYFQKQQSYRSGDLVTTKHVKPIVQLLGRKGWQVPAQDKLLARVIQSGSFLDQTFSTPEGKKFFREISRYPGGVDRVEHRGIVNCCVLEI